MRDGITKRSRAIGAMSNDEVPNDEMASRQAAQYRGGDAAPRYRPPRHGGGYQDRKAADPPSSKTLWRAGDCRSPKRWRGNGRAKEICRLIPLHSASFRFVPLCTAWYRLAAKRFSIQTLT